MPDMMMDSHECIDLRSDTLTQPTAAMREAMAAAVVGDDVFGEDPTVNRLQEMSAALLGHEAGLFVSSGTMGNLAALLAHCDRGHEVILGDECHIAFYEQGGIAAFGGIVPRTLPTQPDGSLELDRIESAIRPDDVHFPVSRLIALENTHNRMGGTVLDEVYTRSVADLTHRRGLKLHLDGARIFNAAAALKVPVKALTSQADSITFCLSKGLCAPVGSVLVGPADFIARARRVRKALGGGMRQAGVLAAAGLVALEQMTDRLEDDHAHAGLLAEGLSRESGLMVEPGRVQTNIVYFDLAPSVPFDAKALCTAAAGHQVKMLATGPRRIRAVTHAGVSRAGIETALQVIAHCMETCARDAAV